MKKAISILMVSLIFSGGTAQMSRNHEQTLNLTEDITEKTKNDSTGKITKLVETIYVYPEDLGYVTYAQAKQICDKVNAQNSYGHNDWRLPLLDELSMIYRNEEKITGLVHGYYFSGLQIINEWGNAIGYSVLNMETGDRKWCRAVGDCQDYLPVDGQANLRLVRGEYVTK
ncbi:MAG: DUF1566 domain-containing protein [Bacteroidales bacterium]|jgi:hypothetical protein|nr:DUF1566 domain-containing protein [Bacteroidales bacterium]